MRYEFCWSYPEIIKAQIKTTHIMRAFLNFGRYRPIKMLHANALNSAIKYPDLFTIRAGVREVSTEQILYTITTRTGIVI